MTHSDSGEHNIPTAFDVVAISGKDEERLLIERARETAIRKPSPRSYTSATGEC